MITEVVVGVLAAGMLIFGIWQFKKLHSEGFFD